MGCGADWITHVLQTIEHCDQVIVPARKCFGLRDAKIETNLKTLFGGDCAGAVDGFVVTVKAKELRFWEGLSHQYGGGTLAAPNIGDARAGLELGLNSLKRRYPRAYEVCCIARPEEFLAAMKHIVMVLMPTHTCAGPEGLSNPR